MKKTIWKSLCIFVALIGVASVYLLFNSSPSIPKFMHLPGVFWLGILFTALLVLATYIASLFFPFKEDEEI